MFQDADMLVAIGAAGIGLMNTKTGAGLAGERHQFLLVCRLHSKRGRHGKKLSGAIERLCRLC
ncbi:hypothetical protein P9738_16340 [Bacillus siamensis]|uniref:hypothetical protein n=1 Tax=Bacillus siamensis TaxID=659243 RepID=UPI0022B781FD|nr:hypothetical protein [Bacillus siamensis]MED5049883.1 hypothetical protein [Bacillus siamensis]MED5097710.1 hypothetical protein [Bacillus siamensis]